MRPWWSGLRWTRLLWTSVVLFGAYGLAWLALGWWLPGGVQRQSTAQLMAFATVMATWMVEAYLEVRKEARTGEGPDA